LSELQAVNADDPADLLTVLELIARESSVTLARSNNLDELAKKLKALDAKASSESVTDSGWLGAPWDQKFLAYDGPYQLLKQIEDEPFVNSMQTALNAAGYQVVLVGQQLASSREQGFRIVYLTDRKSWRQKIVRGDVVLLARPEAN
jgi:Flp pilus assembly CpaE family ATPase